MTKGILLVNPDIYRVFRVLQSTITKNMRRKLTCQEQKY